MTNTTLEYEAWECEREALGLEKVARWVYPIRLAMKMKKVAEAWERVDRLEKVAEFRQKAAEYCAKTNVRPGEKNWSYEDIAQFWKKAKISWRKLGQSDKVAEAYRKQIGAYLKLAEYQEIEVGGREKEIKDLGYESNPALSYFDQDSSRISVLYENVAKTFRKLGQSDKVAEFRQKARNSRRAHDEQIKKYLMGLKGEAK